MSAVVTGVWTLLAAVIRFYAAYEINNRAWVLFVRLIGDRRREANATSAVTQTLQYHVGHIFPRRRSLFERAVHLQVSRHWCWFDEPRRGSQ
jgi:hypothetical protein